MEPSGLFCFFWALLLLNWAKGVIALPGMYSMCRGREAGPYAGDAKIFLQEFPRGAYTTARTVRGNSIFEFEAHIERLAKSLLMMFPDADIPQLTDPKRLRSSIVGNLRNGILEFRRIYPEVADQELRITILIVWDESSKREELLSHIALLPDVPKPPIKVEVRGAPRHNALAKDSQWIRDQKQLVELKASDINEIVLHTEAGELLEGVQTNFYAIFNGKVYTAKDGVLEGTVRRLLLEVCEKNGIPVEFTPPRLEDLMKWEGCLISSTSRLALPIDWIGVPKEGQRFSSGDMSRSFEYSPLTLKIVELVRNDVEAVSTLILEDDQHSEL